MEFSYKQGCLQDTLQFLKGILNFAIVFRFFVILNGGYLVSEAA